MKKGTANPVVTGHEEMSAIPETKPPVQAVTYHTDLATYRRAFEAAMRVFEISKSFPRAEAYSLTDQIRRSSRSVCANLAEAWRKRRYQAAFVAKLSDCESEAAETQTWIEFAVRCGYVDRKNGRELYHEYHQLIGMLVHMIHNSKQWVLK